MARRGPWILVGLLVLSAAGVFMASLVTAANRTRAASGDLSSTVGVLGMPVVTGFRHAHRIGAHLEWGALVLVLVPLVIAQAIAMWSVVRWARSASAAAPARD